MKSPLPISYPLVLAWAMGAAVALKLVVLTTVALRPDAATDIVNLGAAQALVFVVGTLGVSKLHAPRSGQTLLALRPTHPGLAVLGLALGLAVHFPAESVRVLVERHFPTPEEVLVARAALLSADSPLRLILVLLVVACLGPLVEELFFRGALFGAVARARTVLGAAAVTGLSFVIVHLDLRLWPPLLVVAAVLSHLRAASGSLMPCLALHVGFNTVTVLAVTTGAASATSPMRLSPAVTAGGWIATGALVFAVQHVATRAEEAVRARAEDVE